LLSLAGASGGAAGATHYFDVFDTSISRTGSLL
jgi:hypothetical protein